MFLGRNFGFLSGYMVVSACYLVVTACYCLLLGGYWWLLVITACYCSFSLSINGLSILLSYYLSRCFLGIGLLGFSEFWHGARNLIKLCMTEPDFLEKLFFAPEMEKWGHKQGWICSVNENLFYLLCSCTNPNFGKNTNPEI